jgi:hypothetical protein
MEISWTGRVRNEEVLQRVKEERTILQTMKRRKANWIGHVLRRNCRLNHVIEGKLEGRTEMTGRRGGRRQQLLNDLKEKRRYWKLKEKPLDRTLWRTRCGGGYAPLVRLQYDDFIRIFRPNKKPPEPLSRLKLAPALRSSLRAGQSGDRILVAA